MIVPRPPPEAWIVPEQPPPSPLVWLDVLDRIAQSLAQSLHRAPTPAPKPEPVPAAAAEPLRKLDERLAHWQGRLDEMEHTARAVDEQVAGDEAALKDWLARAGQAREQLQEWASRTG
jgi:hypothetical protein